MTFQGRRLTGGAIAMAIVDLLGVVAAASQGAPAQTPQMAEEVYLDVQVFKGIPVDRFNDTMGMFASALLVDCIGCHSGRITFDPEAFAIATPRIQRARQMVVMMNTINKTYFGGEQRVTCFTCHSGDTQPSRSPSLTLQYGELVEDSSSLKFYPSLAAPPAETILARYIEALGGAERLASITSLVATGTYAGFDTLDREVPLEFFARAPDQRAMIARGGAIGAADFFWTYDGQNGWRYQPDTPVPLVELTGSSLVGARIDAMMSFPAQIPQAFGQWQVSFADIDGQQVEVVRGINEGQNPVNLYFDESGMLVRLTRWTDTAAGPVPVQIDYSDYREVVGVQMAFHWIVTWTNGRSTIQLSDVRPNVPIDDARFAKAGLGAANTLRAGFSSAARPHHGNELTSSLDESGMSH